MNYQLQQASQLLHKISAHKTAVRHQILANKVYTMTLNTYYALNRFNVTNTLAIINAPYRDTQLYPLVPTYCWRLIS